MKNIYQNTYLMTTHHTPPLHISITYKMSGSTGPGANRSVEIDVLCTTHAHAHTHTHTHSRPRQLDRCPFRQYIPSKPAKYGIKIWAACDATSSYAWNLQVYTGKPDGGAPEKNQGMRVVLDMSQGLSGHNITCDTTLPRTNWDRSS